MGLAWDPLLWKHIDRPLFALCSGFHLEQHLLVQRRASPQGFESLDVNKYMVTAFGGLDEPEATVILPMGQGPFNLHHVHCCGSRKLSERRGSRGTR